MGKIIELLTLLLDKSNNGIAVTITAIGDVIITIVAKLFDTVFVTGGAIINKTSGLLGVIHDNTGRIKDLLEGKRGGNGTDGTPTA